MVCTLRHPYMDMHAFTPTFGEKDDEKVEKACARPTMAVRVGSAAEVG